MKSKCNRDQQTGEMKEKKRICKLQTGHFKLLSQKRTKKKKNKKRVKKAYMTYGITSKKNQSINY